MMVRKPFREMIGLHSFDAVAEWLVSHPQVLLANQNESMRLFFAPRRPDLTPVVEAPEFDIKRVTFEMKEPGERFIYGYMKIAWSGTKKFNPFTAFEASGIVLISPGHITRDDDENEAHRYEVRFLKKKWHRLVTRMMLEA